MAIEDILITGLDDSQSIKDPDSALYDVYLILSREPSIEWQEIFDSMWDREFYNMKRNAWIEGDRLVVHCVPEEIERYHLERLKTAVAQTNTEHKAYLAKQEREEELNRKREAEEAERMKSLKDNLKF